MPIPPCGFITYRTSQTLHKAVNQAVKDYAHTDLDCEACIKNMLACNPYTRKDDRRKWQLLACRMFYCCVHLAQEGHTVPQ